MNKIKTIFKCSNCGASSSRWTGRCDSCGEWNTLVEETAVMGKTSSLANKGRVLTGSEESEESKNSERIKVGIKEVDNILGGGLMPGSVTLISGEPGIGKSTLLMQIVINLRKSIDDIIYISAEESFNQVSSRKNRISKDTKVSIVNSSSTDDIVATILSKKYNLVIVDSIQTIYSETLSGVAGSPSQVMNGAGGLVSAAKNSDTAVIIVGHVTKEGSIAGPKLLEHLVDTVLYLEGQRSEQLRILRSIKNRFGTTNELAMFEMKEGGLEVVKNPSEHLLAERSLVDGSVIFAGLEGSRPLLVEVQALVQLTNFGYPKRTASGFDLNRLNLLAAVISGRTKLNLQDKDIYINVVGGFKVTEPAADLAICMAIASAALKKPLSKDLVVAGEVGLSGEIRSVVQIEKRLIEARSLGFSAAVLPIYNQRNYKIKNDKSNQDLMKMIKGAETLQDAFKQMLF
jgi:DNA repair protein RadA/Sms